MALSEQEQRALQEIERSLLADDPKFGAAVSGAGGASSALSLRGIAVIVIGLVMLVGGVALSQQTLWFVVLGIFGFLVMLAGAIWMLRGGGVVDRTPSAQQQSAARKSPGNSSGGFSSRMEDNFKKRFEE